MLERKKIIEFAEQDFFTVKTQLFSPVIQNSNISTRFLALFGRQRDLVCIWDTPG